VIGMAYRQWKLALRSPHNIVIPLLEPTVYLLIFGRIMVSLIPSVHYQGQDIDYLTFVLPGVLAMAAWNRGIHAGTPIYVDRMTGELESLFGLPIPRWLILVANMIVPSIQSALYAVAMLVAAHLIGAEITATVPDLVFILVQMIVFSWFVGMTFCALSAILVSQEAFNLLSNILILPLVFTSSAFYPLDAAPRWVQVIGSVNPIKLASDSFRATLLVGTIQGLHPSLTILVLATLASLLSMLVFYRSIR